MAHPIEGILGVSMENIHQMVDVNTIIGDPIVSGETTIIPISKVSFGFASGGSDLPSQAAEKFAGGAGAGVTVKPVAFIVIKADGDVKLLELGEKSSPVEGILDSLPSLFEKIKSAAANKKAAKAEKAENDVAKTEKKEVKVEKTVVKEEKTEDKTINDEKAAERLAKANAKVAAAKAEADAELKSNKE